MTVSESAQQKSKLISLDRRLRLGYLSPPLRRYTAQVVGVALTACLIIFLYALELYPFESTIELPESLSPIHSSLAVPFSLLLLLLVGLGLVAGALFYASYQPGWRLPFLTRLTIGGLTLAFPLSFLEYLRNIDGTEMGPGVIPTVIVWLAIVLGAATFICAFIPSSRIATSAARFATGMFFVMSVAFLMFKVRWGTLTDLNQINPETIPGIHIPLVIIISYINPFVWLVGVVFFWQALTEVKIFSRDIGLRVANLTDRLPFLLATLFVIKTVWLAVGYWSAIRGTAGEPWTTSSQDGPLAWLLAALFAITTGWWLTHNRMLLDVKAYTKATLFITAGFLLLFIASFLLFIPATIIYSLSFESLGYSLGTISATLSGLGLSWTIFFTALLLPLGIVFLRWQKFRYLAPLFLLTGIWAIPPILQALIPGSNLSFEYLTFDTMMTISLFVLSILVWRKKQPKDILWIIALVLVVSTLTALAESLIPEKYARLGFAFLLVLPILYQLLFDSAELNMAGATQGHRVIRTLGFQAMLMVVVAVAFVLGLISPDQPGFEQIANKIFLPPILALYLMVEISRRKSLLAHSSDKAI